MNTNEIRTARTALLRKGQILRFLVEAAETGRVARSADVKFAYSVARRDRLLGGAISSDGEKGYEVHIDLTTRRYACTCFDNGRSGGACKHVAALANRWLANVGRPEWIRLTGLGKAAKPKASVADVAVAV
jgi:hypothetical protein